MEKSGFFVLWSYEMVTFKSLDFQVLVYWHSLLNATTASKLFWDRSSKDLWGALWRMSCITVAEFEELENGLKMETTFKFHSKCTSTCP